MKSGKVLKILRFDRATVASTMRFHVVRKDPAVGSTNLIGSLEAAEPDHAT